MSYQTLQCELTEKEVSDYSTELARITSLEAEVESEKKEVVSDFAARLNKCIADRRVLARKITTRTEYREVETDYEFDYDKGLVFTIRTDTGVTIGQRKLTDDERQQRLAFEDSLEADAQAADDREVASAQEKENTCKDHATCDLADECDEQEKSDLPVCLKDEAVKDAHVEADKPAACFNSNCPSNDTKTYGNCAVFDGRPVSDCNSFKGKLVDEVSDTNWPVKDAPSK